MWDSDNFQLTPNNSQPDDEQPENSEGAQSKEQPELAAKEEDLEKEKGQQLPEVTIYKFLQKKWEVGSKIKLFRYLECLQFFT